MTILFVELDTHARARRELGSVWVEGDQLRSDTLDPDFLSSIRGERDAPDINSRDLEPWLLRRFSGSYFWAESRHDELTWCAEYERRLLRERRVHIVSRSWPDGDTVQYELQVGCVIDRFDYQLSMTEIGSATAAAEAAIRELC